MSRWVVYFQAALLGLVATTFFVFGMMVGTLTSGRGYSNPKLLDHEINGIVTFSNDGISKPDAGAVVLLLPDPAKEISRHDPSTVRPDNFEPLENPSIESIRQQGGTVVRSNIDGKFEIFARPGKYNLLVVSKRSMAPKKLSLSKKQVASISEYFLPMENLIGSQEFYWQPILVEDELINVGEIEFGN